MNTKRIFSIAVLILLCCTETILAAAQDDTLKNKISVDSVKTGNELFVKNCVRCHKLKDPAKYTMAQLPRLVNKMQKRAKITDTGKALILSYLATKAKKQE